MTFLHAVNTATFYLWNEGWMNIERNWGSVGRRSTIPALFWMWSLCEVQKKCLLLCTPSPIHRAGTSPVEKNQGAIHGSEAREHQGQQQALFFLKILHQGSGTHWSGASCGVVGSSAAVLWSLDQNNKGKLQNKGLV